MKRNIELINLSYLISKPRRIVGLNIDDTSLQSGYYSIHHQWEGQQGTLPPNFKVGVLNQIRHDNNAVIQIAYDIQQQKNMVRYYYYDTAKWTNWKETSEIIQAQLNKTIFPSMNLLDNSKEISIINEDGNKYYDLLWGIKFNRGDKYTIYFEDVETNNPENVFLCGFYHNSESRWFTHISKNEPKTLTVDSDDVNRMLLFAGPSYNAYKYDATFKNVCLVKGELPMQWMPSVNDIINSAKS